MNKKKVDLEKQSIIKSICKASKDYRDNLMGKSFLLLYEGQSIEIMFKKENFLHLCGVETHLYAEDFFNKALKGTLKYKEIHFSHQHPFRLCEPKLQNISNTFKSLKKEFLVLTDVKTPSRNYKIGIMSNDTVFCFNTGLIKNMLVPYSLRIGKIAPDKYKQAIKIDYVLSKITHTKYYDKVEFGDKDTLNQYIDKYNITLPNQSIEDNEIEYER